MGQRKFWTGLAGQMHKNAMLGVTFLAASMFTMDPADAGSIQRVSADESSVVVQFDDVVDRASFFTLAGPDRIAVDISGASAGPASFAGGPVRAVRQGQFDADTARIVLDLARPAIVTGGNFSADGRSLKLNLRPAAASEFSGSLVKSRTEIVPPAAFRAEPPKRKYEVSAPIRKMGTGKDAPSIAGPSDSKLPLVIIDAGHGGHDPGSISPHGGYREKDITLSIAKTIRAELLKSGRVRVALTRDTDKFIVLEDRFAIARKMNADLFISIHADSAPNHEATGATVYTLSEVASDREAQRLAARENKADIINGVNLGGTDANVSSILIDLTQRETMNVSADFAKLLIREAQPNMKLRSNSHKFAAFIVLKAPDTPSILFETGYLTNANDVAFLSSSAGQQRVGKSVASAVQVHFARRLAQR